MKSMKIYPLFNIADLACGVLYNNTIMCGLAGKSNYIIQPIPETEPDPYQPLFYVIRIIIYVVRIVLLAIGTINIFVIAQVIFRPYFRSITNVYLISLCAANCIYLLNLTIIIITRLVRGIFNDYTCMMITATEKIGKYLCVISVVLLAADRFWVICPRRALPRRYRTYKTAIIILLILWALTISICMPPIIFSAPYKIDAPSGLRKVCLITWPMYGIATSFFMFACPLAAILYFYYHILKVLRTAEKRRKVLDHTKIINNKRGQFRKVSKLISYMIAFHILCWTPYWLYCFTCALFRLQTFAYYRLFRDLLNFLPYTNCALNPLLYIYNSDILNKTILRNLLTAIFGKKLFNHGMIKTELECLGKNIVVLNYSMQ